MKRLFLVLFFIATSCLASVYSAGSSLNLNPGQSVIVWNAETPTPGNGTTAASQQVSLSSGQGINTPFSVDGHFSGAPGAFEVDVQVASADNDTDYQTCSGCNVVAVDATNNTFHLDAGQAVTRYVRLLMRTRTNAVSITARINR
jgi:hypothetical protein